MTSGAIKQAFHQAIRLVRFAVWPKRHKGVGGTRQRQRGIGNILDADHFEAAQVGRVLQPRQALKYLGFDDVARLLGGVQQLGGLRGAGTIEPVRDERRHNVKEQSGDMTLEGFGDLVDGSQPHVISRCPIQPNHHVLDHCDLTF
jgi:hypothetical protein